IDLEARHRLPAAAQGVFEVGLKERAQCRPIGQGVFGKSPRVYDITRERGTTCGVERAQVGGSELPAIAGEPEVAAMDELAGVATGGGHKLGGEKAAVEERRDPVGLWTRLCIQNCHVKWPTRLAGTQQGAFLQVGRIRQQVAGNLDGDTGLAAA